MLRRREAAALARVVDQIKADDSPECHALLKRIRELGFGKRLSKSVRSRSMSPNIVWCFRPGWTRRSNHRNSLALALSSLGRETEWRVIWLTLKAIQVCRVRLSEQSAMDALATLLPNSKAILAARRHKYHCARLCLVRLCVRSAGDKIIPLSLRLALGCRVHWRS